MNETVTPLAQAASMGKLGASFPGSSHANCPNASAAQPPALAVTQARADTPSSDWLIQCDFDGTISLNDVTDALLRRFGRPGWEELEEEWEQGRIGSAECMQRQVELLDMSPEDLALALDQVAIDPGFPEFVAQAAALGIALQVVSDGLDYAISTVLKRHGLASLPVVANRLVYAGERQWRMETPWHSPACERASANCKCDRLHEERLRQKKVLYVGDSTSDFCVSGKADFVLAKYRLIDHCNAHGIAHVPFTFFNEATALLPKIVGTPILESFA